MRARFLRPLLVLALVGALVPLAAAPAAAVVAPAPIVVNTLLDTVGNDGACSLHEAIEAANTNAASGPAAGECGAGSASSADSISFSVAGTITMTASMPDLLTSMTIDGGGSITVDANGVDTVLSTAAPAIVILKGLTLTGGDGQAGAIGNYANLTLSHVTLIANQAVRGGGVQNATGSTLTISDSTITANTASEAGGGLFLDAGSTATVARTTISDNTAVEAGGGIATLWSATFGSATATVSQSTISGNGASFGGGISTAGTVSLRNSTVAENTGSSGGGGAYVTRTLVSSGPDVFHPGTLSVIASTIALNSSPSGAGVLVGGGTVTALVNALVVGNELGGDWFGGDLPANTQNSLVSATPEEVANTFDGGLADNGGPTRTVKLARKAANLALGRGKATVCAASPVYGVDQRGVARPTLCDVGAFELEGLKPTTSAPRASYLTGGTLSGAGAVMVTWSASDGTKGSGIEAYTLARSVNGGSWSTLSSSLPGRSYDTTFASATTYRFRVRARDRDGNIGDWAYGPTFTARIVQQTASALKYAGSWAGATAPFFSGGTARSSSKAGSSVSYTFTGRTIALVSRTGPDRGRAKVYVNGVLITTIDLSSATPKDRVVAWQRSWTTSASRTVKIVVIGTAGRPRVDIDAFLLLK